MTQPTPLGTVDENGFIWTVPRQIFVRLYVATGDPVAAARDSKLPDGDTAEALLQEQSVKEAIEALHAKVLSRVYESDDTVISRLSNWAEVNVDDYLTYGLLPDGTINMASLKLKNLKAMPRHMQQRLKKIKVTRTAQGDTNFEFEVHDAMKANLELARILGVGSEGEEDAKSMAEQMWAWRQEMESLDDHYDDPDAEYDKGGF